MQYIPPREHVASALLLPCCPQLLFIQDVMQQNAVVIASISSYLMG